MVRKPLQTISLLTFGGISLLYGSPCFINLTESLAIIFGRILLSFSSQQTRVKVEGSESLLFKMSLYSVRASLLYGKPKIKMYSIY